MSLYEAGNLKKESFLGNGVVKFEETFYTNHTALCYRLAKELEREAKKATPYEVYEILGATTEEEQAKVFKAISEAYDLKEQTERMVRYLGNFILRELEQDYIIGRIDVGDVVKIRIETFSGHYHCKDNEVEYLRFYLKNAKEFFSGKMELETCCEFMVQFTKEFNEKVATKNKGE